MKIEISNIFKVWITSPDSRFYPILRLLYFLFFGYLIIEVIGSVVVH